MVYMYRTDNINISSVGTVLTHGLGVTPAGTVGGVYVMLRSAAAASAGIILSLSNSITVTLQAMGGDNVFADVTVTRYHSIIV